MISRDLGEGDGADVLIRLLDDSIHRNGRNDVGLCLAPAFDRHVGSRKGPIRRGTGDHIDREKFDFQQCIVGDNDSGSNSTPAPHGRRAEVETHNVTGSHRDPLHSSPSAHRR